MMSNLKALSLATALAAASLAACGKSSTHDNPPPPSTDTAQLNFEGTQFATWNDAGDLLFDDDNTVQGGSQAITFAQDTGHAKAGVASLQISGTMRQNKYGPDYISDARIYLASDKSAVDFTDKTITVNFYVQSGTADHVQVILNDSAYQACQGKYITSTAGGAWQTVTFKPSDASQVNYQSATFDVTKVAFLEVRISRGTAPADPAVVWNVDSISWEAGTPPPPSDPAQLSFEGSQFTDWNTAGDYLYDDPNTVQGGSQAITFAQDTSHAKAGLASLQISGTMRQNLWGADYISDARIYLSSDKSIVDFTDKTITVNFYVQAGTADNLQVILNDSAYQPCQGMYTASTAGGAWQTVTFKPSDPSQINSKSGTFDITKVAFLEVRISSGAAPADPAVVWNVDSVSW